MTTSESSSESPGESPAESRPGPWLGVDLGQVRIGLAVTDPDLILATPLDTMKRGGRDVGALAAEIADLAERHRAKRVVVGYPLNMNGTVGRKAAEAAELAAALAALGVETALQDERRTTVQASAQLRAAGRRAKEQRPVIDQAAAVLILQAALDASQGTRVGVRRQPVFPESAPGRVAG